MSRWMEKLADKKISRREFLKDSAVATAAVAGLSLFGGQNVVKAEEEKAAEVSTEHTPITDPEEGGKWVGAACWHNCGGRCMNKVMVKDGMVIRQKTDDTHPDSYDYPQQRGCVRGKAQQQQCFGADRIKYPMKRKHWNPGEPNGELRGKDEWERISWDEAIKYVADEFVRIKEAYGAQAFLTGSWNSVSACPPLLVLGGHTSVTDSTSYGTWLLNVGNTIGWGGSGFSTGSDRMDILNADYCVFLSANPAWSSPGTPIRNYMRAKEEAGVKFVTIDPMYTASAQVLDADWVPVRTGTDTSLLLGVASEMLRLDAEEGDIVDWEFLDKYTVGFDADHKPEDLVEDVNFRDYLEGKYDGVAKTAEWASNICGTPVEKITMLARVMSKQNKVWFMYSFASSRNDGAENLPQLVMTIGAMGGHMGKPGQSTSLTYTTSAGNQGGSLVGGGSTGANGAKRIPGNQVEGVILGPQVWDAVFSGKYREMAQFYGRGAYAGIDRECDIHCIVNMDEHAYLQSGPNMSRGIEAYRKVDFTVTQTSFMTTPAKYSDIILPCTTRWEWEGNLYSTNREFLFCATKVVDPLFEAKNDTEIYKLLIDGMGAAYEALGKPQEGFVGSDYYSADPKQQLFNAIAGSWAISADGTSRETLVTITQADIDAWGVEGTPQEGRIGLQEFIDNGGYQVERYPGDPYGSIGLQGFIEDPEKNKRGSKSGKLEITCQAKADLFNSFGLIDWDYKPYPEYIVPNQGYEHTFKDGVIGGEKGELPYLLYDIHYLRRSHSTLDNCPWLREAWPNPFFISAADAKEKGIVSGDTVLITTRGGRALRKACVMQGLMPGVTAIPHGSWVNLDEELGLDRGGAENYLESNELSGGGITPYNNKNCNFEKYDGPELEDDWKVNNSAVPEF
ncbi:MAG: molybdopterin-dependent oxidoreductase [Lachnospiraceae bacterium]|nr:molybdopterin-dependent oxidoreductase [Lachnospiraceae bacterium]